MGAFHRKHYLHTWLFKCGFTQISNMGPAHSPGDNLDRVNRGVFASEGIEFGSPVWGVVHPKYIRQGLLRGQRDRGFRRLHEAPSGTSPTSTIIVEFDTGLSGTLQVEVRGGWGRPFLPKKSHRSGTGFLDTVLGTVLEE